MIKRERAILVASNTSNKAGETGMTKKRIVAKIPPINQISPYLNAFFTAILVFGIG
jgi:hypothetical protein